MSDQLDQEHVDQEHVDHELSDRRAPDRRCEEPLDALIHRLGTPPADILHSWRCQLQVIARACESESGKPFPQLEPANLTIDTCGLLSCGEFRFAPWQVSVRPQMHASQQNVDRLLRALAGENLERPATDQQPSSPDKRSESKPRTLGNDSLRSPEPEHPRANRPSKSVLNRRLATFSAVILCVAIVVVTVHLSNSSRRGSGRADGRPQESAVRIRVTDDEFSATEFSASRPVAPPALAHRSEPASEPANEPANDRGASALLTLDSLSVRPSEMPQGADPLAELMPLRAEFLPSNDALESAEVRGTLDELPPSTAATNSKSPAIADASDNVDLEQEGRPGRKAVPAGDTTNTDTLPDESPQSTRLSTVTTVHLPPIHRDSTANPPPAVDLWETSATDLQLDFPFEVPLSLRNDDSSWGIRDTRNNVPVATIRADSESTRLQWTSSAPESSIAAALSHGRLRSGEQSTIFLRPRIEADPWPLSLEQPDIRPTWDLRGTLPPRVSRISIACGLPRDVELGWIEPLEETNVRRGRAMAVFTPSEGDSVAVGMRLDIRGGRKLSCRIRFAGRLDPAMPWQVISHATLLQFANRLTDQSAALSREQQRLAAVYERADTLGRRVLRLKQDRVETQSESLREMSGRVVELQSLVASLQTHGNLRLRVWVEWPDDVQTILEMSDQSLQRRDNLP